MPALISFTVTVHDGMARTAFPVTGGIPLVRGAVADAAELELRDDRGEAVPLQAQATSRWPDGSVLRQDTLKNRGYVGIAGEKGGMALGLAEVWQSFPKAMRVTERTLEAALWPRECGEPFRLPAAAARTHTLTLTAYATVEELDAALLGLTTPLLPRLAVEDLNATGVMPALPPRAEATAPMLEALTESMFRGWDSFANQSNCGVWGFGELHYGDFTAEDYAKRGLGRYYGGAAGGTGPAGRDRGATRWNRRRRP